MNNISEGVIRQLFSAQLAFLCNRITLSVIQRQARSMGRGGVVCKIPD